MSNCIILTGGTYNPENYSKIQRSLGPYRLASSLEDAGYTTFVLDYIINLTPDEIIKAIDKHLSSETLWVGFSSTFFWPKNNSMYYTNESEVERLIDYIRMKSDAKLVYGGAKAPFFMEDTNIDYYILGNADNSIIDLTNHLAGKQSNITTNIIDSSKYPEPDVKNIPTRWWNYSVLPGEGLPIELARGCIFKCKFCNYPLLGKRKGTYLRDANQIKHEMIKTWEAHGTETYYITDDTFNDDNDKLESLHKVFTSLPFKPKFSSYLRIDLLNKYPHQIQLLEEMGLIGTFFGLETLQPESAKAIGKGLHPNKVKDRLYSLSERWKNKVNIEAGFILGLPYDTVQYFDELIKWCLDDNPIQAIHFYPLMIFPHDSSKNLQQYSSEFSLNPEIYGYTFEEQNWHLKSQDLTYKQCFDISGKFNYSRSPMNKVAGFNMITYLNAGVSLEDIYTKTTLEISNKYNVNQLNTQRLNQYKQLIGL